MKTMQHKGYAARIEYSNEGPRMYIVQAEHCC